MYNKPRRISFQFNRIEFALRESRHCPPTRSLQTRIVSIGGGERRDKRERAEKGLRYNSVFLFTTQ